MWHSPLLYFLSMRLFLIIFLFQLTFFSGYGQSTFHIVPLGVKGGVQEGNLSAYMIAPSGSNTYVCLDAGSLNSGIQKAVSNNVFQIPAESVLKNYVKAYLISHPHLDHLSGLIINSAEDTVKNIYGLPKTLEIIKNHYFNWQSWPNFGNEGSGFLLKKYVYKTLTESEEQRIDQTEMYVTAFTLSHSNPYESTAFLIRSDSSYVLYFGDTGPDEIEKTDHIQRICKQISPLIASGKLKAIFLEVSYPDEQPDNKLYGHLTPKWFYQEMNKLAKLVGNEKMRGLNVVVTHMKPVGNNEEQIKLQLEKGNTLHLKLTIPQQGVSFDL